MSRPARKVTKSEAKIIYKYYTGKGDPKGLTKKAAMEKLGLSDLHTFNSVFHASMMALI